jgi:c-di-GMP-binding flagellar brake protein YcgR
MEVKDSPRIEIEDSEAAAAALQSLHKQPHWDLRVECVTTGERFEVEALSMNGLGDDIRLSINPAGLTRERFDAGIRVHANDNGETLLFTGITVNAFHVEKDPAPLVIGKPKRVYVSNKRESTRIRLIGGMRALVQLQVYEDRNPGDARLVDLSLGGCAIEVPLRAGMLLKAGQQVAALFIEFPNGTRASLPAVVRHVKIAERGSHACVGFSFATPDATRPHVVPRWLREMEREIAFRSGRGHSHLMQPSRLFLGGPDSPVTIRLDKQQQTPLTRATPMVDTLQGVARILGETAIALRHEKALPIERLHAGARTVCNLLAENRHDFLYALCCLDDQPALIQHTIIVAGRLADLVQSDDMLAPDVHEITFAALVHDFGNILTAGAHTCSEDTLITDPDAPCAEGHAGLLAALGSAGSWAASGARRAIIEALNMPDADPAQMPVAQQSLARAAYIVDTIDVISRGLGGREAKPPLQIFRDLYQASNEADRQWLTRYMKRQGVYPIGSLVQYSSGFLAWVLRLGEDGQPSRIRVVRNAGNPRRLNQILGRADFGQIGTLDRPALPQRFGLSPF